MNLGELRTEWRERAAFLDRHSAKGAAEAYRTAADELESAVSGWLHDALTLEEAEAESGYTRGHLRRLIRDGSVVNAGSDLVPRIRRSDLPRKPGYAVADGPQGSHADRASIARAVASGE